MESIFSILEYYSQIKLFSKLIHIYMIELIIKVY